MVSETHVQEMLTDNEKRRESDMMRTNRFGEDYTPI